MYHPTLEEFSRLSRTANVIPVFKEISADLDTPVSSFLKLKKDDYAFLLESVEGQEKIARYSFLGSRPSLVLTSKGRTVELFCRDRQVCAHIGCCGRAGNRFVFTTRKDPLFEIEQIMKRFRPARIAGLPRFYGGFVGYMGYDTVRFFEEIPDKNPDDQGWQDMVFMFTDTILVFDHVNHSVKAVCNCILPSSAQPLSRARLSRFYRAAVRRIDALEKDFQRPLAGTSGRPGQGTKIKITSNFAKSGFCGIVNKAKSHIRRGDIIQVVLSQRFRARVSSEPFDIYRRLRSLNPSPYMFFLKLKDAALVGSSPELLVRCEDGLVATRPIAGTRRRGKDEAEDRARERQLVSSVKEKAEHLMLVDLGRNDLGRVCRSGTVRVNHFMGVERFSHVMHLVSDVTGRLAPGRTSFDALRACFPAGTVSGSPKVRAMQIIDELENTRRGPYAGAVGYFGFSGNLDTCIVIRTIFIRSGTAFVQAGAGIVADSIAEHEYQETVNKAKALFEALGP